LASRFNNLATDITRGEIYTQESAMPCSFDSLLIFFSGVLFRV
jgi:hypothetical protein